MTSSENAKVRIPAVMVSADLLFDLGKACGALAMALAGRATVGTSSAVRAAEHWDEVGDRVEAILVEQCPVWLELRADEEVRRGVGRG